MEPVKLLDGGYSTQLSKHVGNCVDGDPLWSSKFLMTNKEACIQVHRDFIRAGADIILTNTYQASVEGFKRFLNLDEEKSIALIKESVSLAREAIQLELGCGKTSRKILVAGSVGPYGAGLNDGSEYRGDYVDTTPSSTIAEWHKPRLQALLDAGVDLLALETIPALAEAEVLLDLLKQHPKAKAWLSFSCKDKEHTCHGEKFTEVVEKCWAIGSNQLVAIGVNCLHPSYVHPLLTSVRKQIPRIPLICYPNSGETYNAQPEDGIIKWENRDQCVALEDYISLWLELGVQYIGGCCRIDADNIRRLRLLIDQRSRDGKK